MSFTFDVMQRAVAKLRERLPTDDAQLQEAAKRFAWLLFEMDEADQRAGDVFAKDQRVIRAAHKLNAVPLVRG